MCTTLSSIATLPSMMLSSDASPLHAFAAAVFDLDGTLLDTEPLLYIAWKNVAHQLGKDYNEHLHVNLLGKNETAAATEFLRLLNASSETSTADVVSMWCDNVGKVIEDVSCLPGALETVRACKAAGLKLAVATSSTSHQCALKRKKNEELFSMFDAIVCGDDAELFGVSKPEPDIFLLAARRLNVDPKCCIAFEDSPSGMTAVCRAGMTLIAVPDPRLSLDTRLSEDACHSLDAIADIRPRLLLKTLDGFDRELPTLLRTTAAIHH